MPSFWSIRGACVNFDRKVSAALELSHRLCFVVMTHGASCGRGPRQSRYSVEKQHCAQIGAVVRVVVSIACPNLVSARYWVHCSYISNRFKKLTADEANKSRTSGFFFSRLSLSQISGTYAIIRSMLLDWTVELPSFGTEICKGTFFASSLRSFHVLSGSLPSANARGVFADYGSNRIFWKLLPVRM